MRDILRRSNLGLLREVDQLRCALSSASVLPGLSPYYEWMRQAFSYFSTQVHQNLEDLRLGKDEILPDVLSETQRLANGFRLCNEHFIGPLLRSQSTDRLCLRVIA